MNTTGLISDLLLILSVATIAILIEVPEAATAMPSSTARCSQGKKSSSSLHSW